MKEKLKFKIQNFFFEFWFFLFFENFFLDENIIFFYSRRFKNPFHNIHSNNIDNVKYITVVLLVI